MGDPEDASPDSLPELVPGRGRLRDFALNRLKASRMLQISAVVAVLCYGALPFLLAFPHPERPRLTPAPAALMVLMSLASWSLLFWWYPVLKRTRKALGRGDRARVIARTLESVAIGCVMIVQALMAFIIVRAGVSS